MVQQWDSLFSSKLYDFLGFLIFGRYQKAPEHGQEENHNIQVTQQFVYHCARCGT